MLLFPPISIDCAFSPSIRRKKPNTGSHRRAISHDVTHQNFFKSATKRTTVLIPDALNLDSVIFANETKVHNLEEDEFSNYSNIYLKENIEDEEYLKVFLGLNTIKKSEYPLLIKNRILEGFKKELERILKKLLILKKIKEKPEIPLQTMNLTLSVKKSLELNPISIKEYEEFINWFFEFSLVNKDTKISLRELEEGNTKICNFHERAKRELEFLQEKIEKAKVEKNYFQQQRDDKKLVLKSKRRTIIDLQESFFKFQSQKGSVQEVKVNPRSNSVRSIKGGLILVPPKLVPKKSQSNKKIEFNENG